MKVSQIATDRSATRQDLSPLQGMILDEFRRRPGEVFQVGDEELLRIFPDLKRSALSWSLWSLCQKGYVQKLRVRINGHLTTVFGVPKAIGQLKARLDKAVALDQPDEEREELAPVLASHNGATEHAGATLLASNGWEAEMLSDEGNHSGLSG